MRSCSKTEQSSLKFSAHKSGWWQAASGLANHDIARLSDAVDKVEAKGGRESLILLGDLAFVVSIRNRTVITAISHERLRENIFTNIDSAVIS